MLTVRPVRDPDADALVNLMQSGGPPALWQRGVDGARAYIEERSAANPPGPSIDAVDDLVVSTSDAAVPVRLYRPSPSTSTAAVLYFHGGGWVLGSVASSDAFCRRLACAAQCLVISVDYRLAPEHPFPAGLQDACAVTRWAAEHVAEWGADPTQLILLGDSAGGNLATVAARAAAATGVQVRRQILAYPGVAGDLEFPPEYHGQVWPLSELDRQWFLDQYLPDGVSPLIPDIGPLHGEVAGMPPTTILLGGCDPLFGEGLAYAERLINAGVSVDVHIYAGQFHGFLTIDDAALPTSRQALGVVANAIREGYR